MNQILFHEKCHQDVEAITASFSHSSEREAFISSLVEVYQSLYENRVVDDYILEGRFRYGVPDIRYRRIHGFGIYAVLYVVTPRTIVILSVRKIPSERNKRSV